MQTGLNGLKIEKGPDDFEGLTRPTLIKTNDFTLPFQMIVDTYGIPHYKEVNPAYFATISFPFFFGVMFGDIMHGALLFAFGIYLCWSRRPEGSFAKLFEPIRHLLLLMGFFSFFCGFIYNDYTSMTTQVFTSCYKVPEHPDANGKTFAKQDAGCVYPFGTDPIWYRSVQEITFLNSFKMKVSVIYGVCQMLLGTCMKGFNAVYSRRWMEVLTEVLTQIVLLLALFGFMDYLIVVKWTTDWDSTLTGNEVPPAIIQTMITMFIQGGVKAQKPGMRMEADLIPDQTEVMQILVIVALICVPAMLCIKPIFEIAGMKKHQIDDDYE